MKYLVIGAGGTGGSIAAFMTAAGQDVTVIDRDQHLDAIQRSGLQMKTTSRGIFTVRPVKAFNMEQYREPADIVFVCVKDYSLEAAIPFIKQIAHRETVVIPLLNIYGTGSRMQSWLPDLLVTDGCIYLSAEISAPGVILQKGDIFRVVFGVRQPGEYRPVLEKVASDLEASGITCILSGNIRRDALQKFSYVSPMAACGAYYDIAAGAAQQPGAVRNTFIALMREIEILARAAGIQFDVDIVQTNLDILDTLAPSATTSMQRDWKRGGQSEMDGLIFEVVGLGQQYGVDLPTYRMIAAHFGFSG